MDNRQSDLQPANIWHSIRKHIYTSLYLIYINDLPDSVSFSKVSIFADYTKCHNSIRYNDDITGRSDSVGLGLTSRELSIRILERSFHKTFQKVLKPLYLKIFFYFLGSSAPVKNILIFYITLVHTLFLT